MENRIASVFVHVTDLRKSAEWYSRLLGLPVFEERLNGGPVYWFEFKGTHLILDSNTANRQNPEWDESMKPRIMFKTSNLEEAYRYVLEKGETILEPEYHGTMAYFNFRDPEGNAQMVCWSASPAEDTEFITESPILPKIGGVFVDVKHIPETARWYSDLLGVPYDASAAGGAIYSVPMADGAALLLDRNGFMNGGAFTEPLYFETEHFDVALEYISRQGFQLTGEPGYFPDLKEAALLDPDGHRIIVAQMMS
ncbi:VOC family protein [Paenibacillus faecis]|uniref:VOC family protein n=1 Tax=Paenibacillus faecis TaxID=862114 RepID=UPI001478AE95|nr:VOC family protein [Paenibacillus faecis]